MNVVSRDTASDHKGGEGVETVDQLGSQPVLQTRGNAVDVVEQEDAAIPRVEEEIASLSTARSITQPLSPVCSNQLAPGGLHASHIDEERVGWGVQVEEAQ